MSISNRWNALANKPPVRVTLVALGFLLIAVTPLVGPIPGPGGIVVFAAGLTLVLRYSQWAKRQYVKFKRRFPKKGDWADWGLRRQSYIRREEIRKERETAEGTKPAQAPVDIEGELAVETAELRLGALEVRETSDPGLRD